MEVSLQSLYCIIVIVMEVLLQSYNYNKVYTFDRP